MELLIFNSIIVFFNNGPAHPLQQAGRRSETPNVKSRETRSASHFFLTAQLLDGAAGTEHGGGGGGQGFSQLSRVVKKSHRSNYTSQNCLRNEIHSSPRNLYLFLKKKGQNWMSSARQGHHKATAELVANCYSVLIFSSEAGNAGIWGVKALQRQPSFCSLPCI